MSDFSDREDRHLVQLAKGYEDRQVRVAWPQVTAQMKYSHKPASVLRARLATLKRAHGKTLKDFPAWYFYPPSSRAQAAHPPSRAQAAHPSPRAQAAHPPSCAQAVRRSSLRVGAPMDHCVTTELCVPRSPRSSTTTETSETNPKYEARKMSMEASEAHAAVEEIFKHVSKKEVRQPAGRVETNVGEVSPVGVTQIIGRCNLTDVDVFLDVGSGVGNIIAQVALQTTVERAIGIEIRSDVAPLSKALLKKNTTEYPRLATTFVLEGDVCDLEKEPRIASTTVLFVNNYLFTPTTNLSIHRLSCQLPHLRLVLLCHRACPRHKPRCREVFCSMRSLRETVAVTSEFKASAHELYVYERKQTQE